MNQQFDVVIIGAGAAGLMCAIEAGKRGRKVMLLDHARSAGKKIRISGGGRCNFTNLNVSQKNYLSENPNFCLSALNRYTPNDFISLVEKHRIRYHEKTLGQLFCDSSASQIVDMLLLESQRAGVTLKLEVHVSSVIKNEELNQFEIVSNQGTIYADSLVVASGGTAIPQMGATGFGYNLAKQFGLKVVPPRPGLVPLTLDESLLKDLRLLSGVSLKTNISDQNSKISFQEAMLITHKGLSGPAILQISSYWKKGEDIIIDLMPELQILEKLKVEKTRSPQRELQTLMSETLPKRLTEFLLEGKKLNGYKLKDLSLKQMEEIAQLIHAWRINPNGSEGLKKAEVTLGGVDTHELSSKTFESKKVSGLYFIGEVVDVTGHLGGYNFQWAWSSGYAAGQFV